MKFRVAVGVQVRVRLQVWVPLRDADAVSVTLHVLVHAAVLVMLPDTDMDRDPAEGVAGRERLSVSVREMEQLREKLTVCVTVGGCVPVGVPVPLWLQDRVRDSEQEVEYVDVRATLSEGVREPGEREQLEVGDRLPVEV